MVYFICNVLMIQPDQGLGERNSCNNLTVQFLTDYQESQMIFKYI